MVADRYKSPFAMMEAISAACAEKDLKGQG